MAAEHVERIGARMRQRREELDLSRAEVSRRMPGKTSENQIYRWEKGQHMPEPENIEGMAKALEVDTSYFYVDSPAVEETPDLMATVNGSMPDDLREHLQRIEANQRTILANQQAFLDRLNAPSGDHDLLEQINARVEEIRAASDAAARRAARRKTRPATG